jgi:serine/threonine protein kinase
MGAHDRPAQANDGPEIGSTLLGKYTVERVIGKGGMAFVVAAYHADLRQHVAIKLLRPEALLNESMVERFMREARASARLESEHVVKIIDVGRLASGAPYMVMEYLEGRDLRHVLADVGTVPRVTAVDYILQAIDAIAEAHAHGIVHRDLKPANVFLASRSDGSQSIKVLDFGVAKVHEADGSGLTGTKMLLGSPRYMSPEQFRSAKSVDHRTDVWALGTLLYRLLSGVTPFDGESMAAIMSAILDSTPEPLYPRMHGVSAVLDGVVQRCMEKDPARRFPSVAALAEALAPFGSGKYNRCVERASKLLGRSADDTVVSQRELGDPDSGEPSEVFAYAETRIAPMPVMPAPIMQPTPRPLPAMPAISAHPTGPAISRHPTGPTGGGHWGGEMPVSSSRRRSADRTAAAIGVGTALAIALVVALVMHLTR